MKKIYLMMLLCFIMGCEETQSPNAKYLNDFTVALWYEPGVTGSAWNLDKWMVSEGYGQDIYTAAFGYVVTVGGDGMPISGIRVDCYTEKEPSSFFQDDIWEEEAPIGKPYGFVAAYPKSGSTWDFNESHATVKTNSDGKAAFFIGLGDPNEKNTESGWLWPSGNNEVVTGVNLKFVVHKSGADLVKECFCYFVRHEGDSFWAIPNTATGVFYSSASWLIPYSTASSSLMGEEVLPIKEVVESEVKPRVFGPEDYSSVIKGGPMAYVAELGTYENGEWAQSVDPNRDTWVAFNSMKVLVSPNLEDPNDGNDMLSASEPYVFFYDVTVDNAEQYNAVKYTFLLISKTEGGEVVSWRPIWMQVYDRNQTWLATVSEYIVPIDSRVGEGRYYDRKGRPGTLIYVAENGYLELKQDDYYGDFNYDGRVDLKDFSMFAGKWGKGLVDEDYDLIFDATEDGQTNVNDLREFVGNWLGVRP